MALVRLGRPTFLADTALSLLFGAAGGLVVTAVVALADFPEWSETLLGSLGAGAGGAGAAAVLSLAFLRATGDAFPG